MPLGNLAYFYLQRKVRIIMGDLTCRECQHVSADKINSRIHQALNHAFTKVYKCFRCEYSIDSKLKIISHALEEHLSLENYEGLVLHWHNRRRSKRKALKICELPEKELDNVDENSCNNEFEESELPDTHYLSGEPLSEPYPKDCGVSEDLVEAGTKDDEYNEEAIHKDGCEKSPALMKDADEDHDDHGEFINRDGAKRKFRAMCDLCGKKFEFRSYLTKHMKAVHLKIKPHSCEHCKKSFSKRDYLNFHLELVHDIRAIEPGRAKMCEDCGKNFFSRQALEIHRNGVHLKIHNYKCDACDYTTAQPGHIKRHMGKTCPVMFPEKARYHKKSVDSEPKNKKKGVAPYVAQYGKQDLEQHQQPPSRLQQQSQIQQLEFVRHQV